MFALLRKPEKKKKKSKIGPLIGLVFFIILMVYGGGKGIAKVIASKSPASHGSVHSGRLSCKELEELWEAAGGSKSAAFLAAEVARAESAGNQYSRDPKSGTYSDGTVDEGYWQVNSVHSRELADHGLAVSYDPLMNAKDAVFISDDGTDWWPWITYRKGAEVGQC